MIKVMIVEDEPPIQRSIKSAIESTVPGFEVIACAFNGEAAISMLKEIKPDVIFTDIRMPVMDGIELMSYLSKTYPEILTVVLSGYQEFEYAKKALQYNAFDYILKPLSIPELKILLQRISSLIISRKDEWIKNYMEKLLSSDNLNKKQLITEIYSGYNQYIVILLCAGAFPSFPMDYLIPARNFWEKINLSESVKEIENENIKVWVINGKSSAEKIVIFAFNNPHPNQSVELSKSLSSILFVQGQPLTMVVSTPLTDINEVGYVSQLLRMILNKRNVIGISQTIFQNDSCETDDLINKRWPLSNKEIENVLILALKQGNINLFKSKIQEIFDCLQKSLYPQIWVEKFLKHIVTACQYSVSSNIEYDPANLELEINEAITNSLNYNDLFNNLWFVFEELFTAQRSSLAEKGKIPELILKLEKFLQENMCEPITNLTLAEKFGLVPSYLSKLFKTYKGMSPSEYLTALKIEKAKELLITQPNLLAKEIAIQIGYSDPLYFSRIFKNETGIRPSEYKKVCG